MAREVQGVSGHGPLFGGSGRGEGVGPVQTVNTPASRTRGQIRPSQRGRTKLSQPPWWKNPPQDDDLVQMAMGYILDYDNESESAARGLAELKSEISGLDRERLEDLLLFRLLEHARTGLDADDELDESEATSP